MRQNMTVIMPEVGRVLWYRREPTDTQPFQATICYVWGDRRINVAGFDAGGNPYKAGWIILRQEGDPQPPYPYAEWMPYQIGQAKKHEKEVAWEREMETCDLVVHHDEPQQAGPFAHEGPTIKVCSLPDAYQG
jgi:hypothetical protein